MDDHFIGVLKTTGTIRLSKENDELHDSEEILLSGPTTIDRNRCSRPRKQNTPMLIKRKKKIAYNVALISSAKSKDKLPINSTGTNFFTACF